MDEQDNDAARAYINSKEYIFDMDGDCWENGMTVSILGESEEAFLAGIKYERNRKLNE